VKKVPKERRTDNITMRLWLETLESVLGYNGLKSLLNYGHIQEYIDNFPPDNDELNIPLKDLHALYVALLDVFGEKGARSLQLRIGREFIRIGVTKRPTIAKMLKLSTRLLPEHKKIKLALQKFADEFDRRQPSLVYSPRMEVEEKDDCFLLIDKDSFESNGVTSDNPMCATCVGRLQYMLEWITGNTYDIQEVKCRAMGDSCDVFRVSKDHQEN
jgi:predicted hydrocarbon binding protein